MYVAKTTLCVNQPELPYPRKSKLMQVSNNVPVGRSGNACDAARLINPMRCDFGSIRLD